MDGVKGRVLAIGDIHGCLMQFDRLLEAIRLTADDHLILLGDMVDRGPASKGVIDRVLKLRKAGRVSVVMGNHEEMMVRARDHMQIRGDWLMNGGNATLRSYAGARAGLRDIPEAHWDLLTGGLVQYVETETHIFVHASAYPDMAMDEQPNYMLRWERFEKVVAHESGKVLVCGHTPQASGLPSNRGFAICIDTYACGGGRLSCLDAGSGRVWQADAEGKISRLHISDCGEAEDFLGSRE